MSTRVSVRESVTNAAGTVIGEIEEHPDGTWWARPPGSPFFTWTADGTRDAAIAHLDRCTRTGDGYRPKIKRREDV